MTVPRWPLNSFRCCPSLNCCTATFDVVFDLVAAAAAALGCCKLLQAAAAAPAAVTAALGCCKLLQAAAAAPAAAAAAAAPAAALLSILLLRPLLRQGKLWRLVGRTSALGKNIM